jgi:hypothetical protein
MFGGRIARRVGVDRNPLRRRSDRVESWLTLVIVTLILVAGPYAAWCAADAVSRDSARAAERDRQHRFQVSATLAEDVPTLAQRDDEVRTMNAVARARWVAPNGSVRTGLVEAPPGQRAGTTVGIWTDVHGGPTRPPVRQPPATTALAAGILAIFGVLVVALGVLMVVHWRFFRRRMDEWQVEWMFVEPVWSGRRRPND